MYCNKCGQAIAGEAKFCVYCGQATNGGPAATAPTGNSAAGRIGRHYRTVGILWAAYALLRVIPFLALLGIRSSLPWLMHMPGMTMPRFFPAFAMAWMAAAAWILGISALLAGLLALGLLQREGWARIYGIVLAILSLLSIPFGTALGIYTLWVLLPAPAEQEWRQLSA